MIYFYVVHNLVVSLRVCERNIAFRVGLGYFLFAKRAYFLFFEPFLNLLSVKVMKAGELHELLSIFDVFVADRAHILNPFGF